MSAKTCTYCTLDTGGNHESNCPMNPINQPQLPDADAKRGGGDGTEWDRLSRTGNDNHFNYKTNPARRKGEVIDVRLKEAGLIEAVATIFF